MGRRRRKPAGALGARREVSAANKAASEGAAARNQAEGATVVVAAATRCAVAQAPSVTHRSGKHWAARRATTAAPLFPKGAGLPSDAPTSENRAE